MKKRIGICLIVLVFTAMLPFAIKLVFADTFLIDGYIDTQTYGCKIDGTFFGWSQSFTCDDAYTLTFAEFRITKTGNPTGTLTCYLFDITGTYGVNAKPTGSALATSEAVNVASFGSASYFNFTFTDSYSMSAGYYCIALIGSGSFSSSNYLTISGDSSSPSHDGNYAYYFSGSWTGNNPLDVIFMVFGDITDTYPTYSNVGDDGITLVGSTVSVHSYWEDDVSLVTCYLSTNVTEEWVNSSISVSGVTSWANSSFTLNFNKNVLVQYKFYCQDSFGHWNVTGLYNITTTSLNMTFYLNYTDCSFYINGINRENGTEIGFNYNETIDLAGVVYNQTYNWISFNATGYNLEVNPNLIYATINNNNVWCYFGFGLTDETAYNELMDLYLSLNTTYYNLLNDYYSLNSTYYDLIDDFDLLNSTYYDLLDEYDLLNSTYYDLIDDFNSLNSTYYDLLDDFNSLNSTYYILLNDYDLLNSTHYDLIDDFNSLNSTYYDLLDDFDLLNSTYYDLLDSCITQEDYDEVVGIILILFVVLMVVFTLFLIIEVEKRRYR